MIFKPAKLDALMKFLTWGIILLIIVVFYIVVLPGRLNNYQTMPVYVYFPFVFILGMALVAYGMGPRYYYLNENEIVIQCLLRSIKIPCTQITAVELVANAKLSRVVGNGGFFHYSGIYNDGIANARVYATTFQRMIRIEADKTYYLSPEKPELLIRKFEMIKQHK